MSEPQEPITTGTGNETAAAPTPITASTNKSKRDRSDSPSEDVEERSVKRANTNTGATANDQVQEEEEGEEDRPEMNDQEVNKKEDGQATGSVPMQVDTSGSGGRVNTGSQLPPAHESLPPTPQTAPPHSAGSHPPGSAHSTGADSQASGNQVINMRCLIVTMDASVIIGKGGRHIAEIRSQANARVNISESIPGNPERILSVQGALDAVAKAFGLIVRRINDENFGEPSMPGSRPVTIKFMIPNSRMGSVIGKGGSKIKEIQEASGARLNASEQMLPGSTERILSVSGVADAVHIAVYYIGTILLEYQERAGHNGAGSGAYRQQGGSSSSHSHAGVGAPRQPSVIAPGPGSAVQQFWIPDELVGSIIGKAGIKINEIRTQSQCHVRVTDPGTPATPGGVVNPGERLIIISGHPTNLNMAVGMLHARLEQEKAKKLESAGGGSGGY